MASKPVKEKKTSTKKVPDPEKKDDAQPSSKSKKDLDDDDDNDDSDDSLFLLAFPIIYILV